MMLTRKKGSELQVPVSWRWLIMTEASHLLDTLHPAAWERNQPCHKRCSLEVSLFMAIMMNGGHSTSGWRLFICEHFLCPEPDITRLFCYFTSLFNSHSELSKSVCLHGHLKNAQVIHHQTAEVIYQFIISRLLLFNKKNLTLRNIVWNNKTSFLFFPLSLVINLT